MQVDLAWEVQLEALLQVHEDDGSEGSVAHHEESEEPGPQSAAGHQPPHTPTGLATSAQPTHRALLTSAKYPNFGRLYCPQHHT